MNKSIEYILKDVDGIKSSTDEHEVNFLKQRIETACKALMGTHIEYDQGPWSAMLDNDQVYLESDDFEHDATLKISGDFYNTEAKLSYAKKLADKLNQFDSSQRKRISISKDYQDQKLYDQKTIDEVLDMYTRNRNVTWVLEYTTNSGVGTGVDLVFSDGKRYNVTNYDCW